MDHGLLYTILASLFCLLMAWGVGANDLANVMSTTMGSKAITVRQAMIIAIIFEFAGAILGGEGVTNTIRNGIININSLNGSPDILIYGMMAVLLAGTVWMSFASYMGLPVSITNAIIGSIVGFGMVVLGIGAIHWVQVGYIALSWICSPLIAGILAFGLFNSIQELILSQRDPVSAAHRYIPIYLFLVGFVLSAITIIKGLEHFGISLSLTSNFAIAATTGFLIILVGKLLIRRIPYSSKANRRDRFNYVERMFAILMAFTACAMVFAHGSNDVAIAVGPLAVVVGLSKHGGSALGNIPLPYWVVIFGCSGVVIGLLLYGRKVIETVGSNITELTPSRAFAATISAATTVVISTSFGIPVSATQTLVGAVLGVGLARGIGALNLHVVRNIFMSWIITLPAASILTIAFFYLFKFIFK